jgi:general secretion pathway protein I
MRRVDCIRARQSGFTLLEAIVAMVLIGTAGLALFSWINGSMISLTRVQETNARSDATINVLEYMHRVNPMLSPEGRATFGEYSIQWRARPISPIAEGVDQSRGLSLYQMGLFSTLISVTSDAGGLWFELRLQQVGYKKVRSGTPQD